MVAGYLQETLSFCHAQSCFSLKRRIRGVAGGKMPGVGDQTRFASALEIKISHGLRSCEPDG